MGLTLPGSDGIHLLEDDLIFEIHNDHLCVTNLFNYTMPLIRYRLDDVLLRDQPDSQYPFTKIREIAGRYEDAMAFTNSLGQRDFIHPIIIVELMIPGLRTWQVELLNETSFLFRARFEPNLSPMEKQRSREYLTHKMRSILDEKLMHNVMFRIEEVNHIPVDPSTGKFRLILRPQHRMVEAAVA
jgi:phenylacetate-coenzyme A ligase PaaK-like adenylate-forming protein